MTSRRADTHREEPTDGRARSTKRFRTIKRRILRTLADRGVEIGDVQEFAAHDIALCTIILEHKSDAVARGDDFDSEEMNRLIRTRQLLLRRLGLTTDGRAVRTSRATGLVTDDGDGMNLEGYVQQQERRRERFAARYGFDVRLFAQSGLDIDVLRKLRAEGDDVAIRKAIKNAKREALASRNDDISADADDDLPAPVKRNPNRSAIRRIQA